MTVEPTSLFRKSKIQDVPGGPGVKNLPAHTEDVGFLPGPGRSPVLWSN